MIDKKHFFDGIAREWDAEHSKADEEERLNHLIGYLSLKKGAWVLDVGCGTGRLVPPIRRVVGDSGRLIELDFSRKMLKICRRKYTGKQVYFIQSNAQMIAVKGGIFDNVICFSLFPHMQEKLNALIEFRRLLKPGQSLAIAHLMSREMLNQFHSQVKGPVSEDYLPDNREMKMLFSDAGFRNISIVDKPSLYLAQAIR